MKGFTTTFLVEESREEVVYAVNNVRGWWSGNIEGSTDKLGAEWTYSYKDMHRSKQKITELVPGKRIVWHVLDSYLSFVKDKTEWNGTDVVFEISKKGDKTQLKFTHAALAPEFGCFDHHSKPTRGYINRSPTNLDTNGNDQTT